MEGSGIGVGIFGTNITRVNVIGIFETIAKSKTCGLLFLQVHGNLSEVEHPFRSAGCKLGDAPGFGDRDCCFERLMGAGAAAGHSLSPLGVGPACYPAVGKNFI